MIFFFAFRNHLSKKIKKINALIKNKIKLFIFIKLNKYQ